MGFSRTVKDALDERRRPGNPLPGDPYLPPLGGGTSPTAGGTLPGRETPKKDDPGTVGDPYPSGGTPPSGQTPTRRLPPQEVARRMQSFYGDAYFGGWTPYDSPLDLVRKGELAPSDVAGDPMQWYRMQMQEEGPNRWPGPAPATIGGFGYTPEAPNVTPDPYINQIFQDQHDALTEGIQLRSQYGSDRPTVGSGNLANYGVGQLRKYGVGSLNNYGVNALRRR